MSNDIINMDKLDEHLQSFVAEAELEILNIKCSLNHGIPYEENPLAVDYLCQSFGDMSTGVADSMLQIPICAECLVGLYSEYQLLMVCVNCISSQWIFLPEAKREYPKDTSVLFLKQCPKCYEPEE